MKFFNAAYLTILAASAVTTTSAFSLAAPRCSSSSLSSSFSRSPQFVARHVSLMSSEEEISSSVEQEEKVEEEDVKHTVYVGNLPFTTTGDDIMKMFQEKGLTVLNVSMPKNMNVMDDYTGEPRSKGFCFVDVESEDMIASAVDAFNLFELGGRPMRVNKLLPKEEVQNNNNARNRDFTPDGQKKLYVGNLPFEATDEDVKAVFSEYGEVSDIFLPMRDGSPRGFCFITLDEEGADKAMADLNGSDFQGRDLVVNEPLKKGEKPPQRNSRPQFKLYVGNLSFYTTQETLYNVFSEFGNVYDCYLPTDPNTDQPRGFGFVTMERADGEAAIEELDGLELDGRFIRVNEAQGKRRPSPPPRSYDNDDYDGGNDEGGFY